MMSQLRIAAIGKTGVGKSSFGNIMLNKKTFKSSSRGTSVTRICQSDEAIVNNRKVSLVDSPGFNDTETENQDEIMKEIKRCMFLSAPGPHAICFVVQIGRFTLEDIGTMSAFVKHFGEALYEYVIIVFTRYDDYERDCEEDEVECKIQNYVSTLPPTIKDFVVEKCGSRVIGFDNTLKGEKSQIQVNKLLQIIDEMLLKNGNKYYSNEDLQKADEIIEADMKREKLRIEQEMKEEMEKRQIEIEKEADKKSVALMKQEMLTWKEDMNAKLEEESLRRNSQKSATAFETFEKVVSLATNLLPLLAPVIKSAIQKAKQSKENETATSTAKKKENSDETANDDLLKDSNEKEKRNVNNDCNGVGNNDANGDNQDRSKDVGGGDNKDESTVANDNSDSENAKTKSPI